MSVLITPPSTGHRTRRRSASTRVAWAAQNEFFCLSAPLKGRSAGAPARRPARSILKPPPPSASSSSTPSPPPPPRREETPEPADPLEDADYLARPLAIVLCADTALRDLVDAYAALTARVRASGADNAPPGAWPLLAPLRVHNAGLVDALCRDVHRALEDPAMPRNDEDEEYKGAPPSPRASPTKRRCGLTEDEVKHARDLFATAQAALRFLLYALAAPTVYGVFTDEQLGTLLTDVLAIPLASELPTPNARKTHSTAIWLLQTQRLPPHVLAPAADRIAYAIRRGIDGELGKEGKKGACSDGLKAIHDLSFYQPTTFVSGFVELLPSICANLLGPALNLRIQAAQALGGLAYALSSKPGSPLHARASEYILDLFTAPASPAGSPNKESAIVRTLRTTMSAAEAAHPAHGPQWAACTLAALVALLGSRLYTDGKITRAVTGLLSVCMKHRKSSVRALCCAVWRVLSWCYFVPAFAFDEEDAEEEMAGDTAAIDVAREAYESHVLASRARFWDTLQTVHEMGAGAALVAALLGDVPDVRGDLPALTEAADVLLAMARKRGGANGALAREAGDVLQALLSPFALPPDAACDAEAPPLWENVRLLAPPLFSAAGPGGLLATELGCIVGAVRPLIDAAAGADDVRGLAPEELAGEGVFELLAAVWKAVAVALPWPRDNNIDPLLRCWRALFAPAIEHLQDTDDVDEDISRIAQGAARIIGELAQDPTFGSNTGLMDTTAPDDAWSALTVKWHVIEALWARMRDAVPAAHLRECAPGVQAALAAHCGGLDEDDDALAYWARACALACVLGDREELSAFFANLGLDAQGTLVVWTQFAEVWTTDPEASMDEAVFLLGELYAFTDGPALDDSVAQTWDALLARALEMAASIGDDRASVLDDIARAVPAPRFPLTLADALLAQLEPDEMRAAPCVLLERVDGALARAYEGDVVPAVWVLRTLTQVLGACPRELLVDVLAKLEDGLGGWVADEAGRLTESDYAADIVPLYETILVELRAVPLTLKALARVATVLEAAFRGDVHARAPLADAFREFWTAAGTLRGWDECELPARIQRCLRAIEGIEADAEEVAAALEGEESTPTRPCTPVRSSRAEDDAEPLDFPDSDEDDALPVLALQPTTPGSSLVFPPPHRPTELFSSPAFPPPSSSPVPSTPLRSTSPLRASRPRALDKENTSPGPRLPTLKRACEPAEDERAPKRVRLDVLNVHVVRTEAPVVDVHAPFPTTPRKALDFYGTAAPSTSRMLSSVSRALFDEQARAPTGSEEEEEASDAESTPTKPKSQTKPKPEPQPEEEDELSETDSTPTKPKMKRKRLVLDCVEVPTLRALRGYRAAPLSHGGWGLRKSNSEVHPRSRALATPPKRRRRAESAGESSSAAVAFEMVPFNSDDSIMQEHVDLPDVLPSSDDDPHAGQVTPRTLTSPAPQRRRDLFGEEQPGSDDLLPSPSRDVVRRRSLRNLKYKKARA